MAKSMDLFCDPAQIGTSLAISRQSLQGLEYRYPQPAGCAVGRERTPPGRSVEPVGTRVKRATSLVAAHGDGSLRINIYVMDDILVEDYHGGGAYAQEL